MTTQIPTDSYVDAQKDKRKEKGGAGDAMYSFCPPATNSMVLALAHWMMILS